MQIDVNIVNAFVDHDAGGNPAGVVLDADRLSASQKQEIAAKAALSETAFVSNSNTDTYKVEFFTPTVQIPHCGHATVATFSFLNGINRVGEGKSSKESIDGSREIIIHDGSVFMEQLAPKYTEIPDLRQDVLTSLGLTEDQLTFAPMRVNTGNNFVVVGVKSADVLGAIEPDQALINDISEKLDLVGYYIFTFDVSEDGRDASARMFAPRFGIPEEAATGMAAGPLACVLFDHMGLKKDKLLIEQGAYMQPASPSLIRVHLTLEDNKIKSLMSGGLAKKMSQIQVEI
ncbi:MAG: PhzF family phenazine biosynthesis protein [Alphaproteobacteria bacterium]|nr:PhzF family phenazine biosynthesis protein [Alphaproteobacteria bacterium]